MTFRNIIFGLFILVSCNQQQTTQDKTKSTYKVNPKLIKSSSDTLFVNTTWQSENYFHFNDKDGYCTLRNDTLMIFYRKGHFTHYSMSILITNGTFSNNIDEYGCVHGHTYSTLEQQLTLNKNNFMVNDTIVGEIFFKSIFVQDSITNNVITIDISGKFKLRIRDADFDYNTFTQEKNYQKFLEISKNRPDTISTLVLLNCGLKKLPEEISLFKNLKDLHLDENDLSNADLSILAPLTKMRIISFRSCNLNEFPSVVFNFKELKELNLYNNNIKELTPELSQMTSLSELQIGRNDFTTLPSDIGNLKNLEMLCVENTPIRVFPISILQLTKLKEIYPPDTMDYFPPQLAKYLSQYSTYSGIKNLDEFKNNIPKEE